MTERMKRMKTIEAGMNFLHNAIHVWANPDVNEDVDEETRKLGESILERFEEAYGKEILNTLPEVI
jgi:hypothetical protein